MLMTAEVSSLHLKQEPGTHDGALQLERRYALRGHATKVDVSAMEMYYACFGCEGRLLQRRQVLHAVQRSAMGTGSAPQDLDPQHKYAIRALVAVAELYRIRSLTYVGCADMGWFRVALETFTASDKGFQWVSPSLAQTDTCINPHVMMY